MNLTLLLLAAYSVLMAGVGLRIGRRVRSTGDFFVAGRSLGPGLIFATFLAANIGAGSTVGAASLAFRDGASAWWWNASAGIGSLIFAFTVGPRMWRESTAYGDLTVGDFLERRYGATLRGLVALLIWIGTLSILAAQLIGISTILQVVGGVSKLGGCIAGAVIVTAYFAAGGLLSSVWVNLVQLTVKLVGFALVTPVALALAGGWDGLAAEPGRLDLLAGGSPQSGWRLLFFLAPAFIVSPGLIQKMYGARDARAGTIGVACNGVALVAFAVVPVVIGMTARVLYPEIPRELAFATVAGDALPAALGVVALAAVFSAETSAADAVLFMLATSASRDFYRGYLKPEATDGEVLRFARLAAVVGAVLGIALAMAHRSIIDALGAFYGLLVVTLFVPIVGGLYGPAGGRRRGLHSLLGVPVWIAVHFATAGSGFGPLTPVLAGVLVSAAAFLVGRGKN